MPWSIFDQSDGEGLAVGWADSLLRAIHAPLTAGNEQVVYDWEKSEGGGGRYNPLNQGPVPNEPGLTTSGSQYGGGAADYASWSDGVTGAADYLAMPNFAAIRSALRSNNPAAARSDIVSSGWAASHYDNGAAFSDAPLPGKSQALPAGGSAGSGGSGGGGVGGVITTGLLDAISPLGLGNLFGGGSGGILSLPDSVAGIAAVLAEIPRKLASLFTVLAWLASPVSWLRIFVGAAGIAAAAGGVVALVGVY